MIFPLAEIIARTWRRNYTQVRICLLLDGAPVYHLDVIHPGMPRPTARRSVDRAQAVLELIPELLGAHPDCDRIIVWIGLTRLFAVDCKGNRLNE